MDSMLAYAMGLANRGKEQMVFDWDKAARIIKERNIDCAAAGLKGDFEWTGGCIFKDGKPIDNDYTFLASTWAIPCLYIRDEEIPCYIMKHETEWNANTKWPVSAMTILLT